MNCTRIKCCNKTHTDKLFTFYIHKQIHNYSTKFKSDNYRLKRHKFSLFWLRKFMRCTVHHLCITYFTVENNAIYQHANLYHLVYGNTAEKVHRMWKRGEHGKDFVFFSAPHREQTAKLSKPQSRQSTLTMQLDLMFYHFIGAKYGSIQKLLPLAR